MPEDPQRKSFWGVTRLGEPSGIGDCGKGLWSNRTGAEIHYRQLLQQSSAWEKEAVEMEEIQLTDQELAELQKALKPQAPNTNFDAVHIGPKGGRYRLNSSGRKSYDVP